MNTEAPPAFGVMQADCAARGCVLGFRFDWNDPQTWVIDGPVWEIKHRGGRVKSYTSWRPFPVADDALPAIESWRHSFHPEG